MHPKAVSKGWGGLSVKSEKRGIGSCVNESVMTADLGHPAPFFLLLHPPQVSASPGILDQLHHTWPTAPLSCQGPMCSFSGRSLVLSRVWREGKEDRED